MVKEKTDADKSKAELIKKSDTQLDHNSRQKNCRDDLEAERDRIESLRNDLMEKQKELDLREDALRLQLDEVNARGEDFVRANAALRESEEKFRILAETVNAGIVLYRGDRYIYVNPMVEKALGYSKDELLAMNTWDIMHPDYREIVRLRGHERLQGLPAPPRYEVKVLTKGGETRWVEFSAGTIQYQGQPTVIATIFDITDRKLAEEERDWLYEYSRDILFIISFDGCFKLVSPSIEKILGWKEEELPGKHFVDFTHPDDREFSITTMKEHETGKDAEFENRVLCKDGSYRWISWNAHPLVAEKIVIGVGRDVTERKRAEEALQKSEEKYRRIVETANEGIWIIDRDARTTFVNDKMLSMLGYTIEEMLGKKIEDFICDSHLSLVHSDIGRYLRGAKIRNDSRLRRKDGSHLWCIVSATPIMDEKGDFAGGIGMITDITERKRAEEALIKDRHILTKSQEVAHVGNWAWDRETGGLTGSAENDRIFGFEPGGIEPTIEWLLSRVLPDDRAAMADFIEARVRDGKWGSIDYRIRRPDGSVGYVNTIVDKSVRDGSGRITRLYGISQDVTERKRTEDELKAAKLQAELYVDLMGHDINNMHQIALGYLELAREMPPCGEQAALLDKSEEVLKRSTKLIGNVRKLQKLHEGVFQNRDIDACKVLADVQSEYGAVPGKTISLNMSGYETCMVRANELLHDVFTNLMNNAVKHTKDGTEITVALDMTESNGKRYCLVTVEDNGPGIPDDYKERIFNRIHIGTARGMGLGLYLVKSLVESYSGKVWVEDRIKGDHAQGARFVVMLPAADN